MRKPRGCQTKASACTPAQSPAAPRSCSFAWTGHHGGTSTQCACLDPAPASPVASCTFAEQRVILNGWCPRQMFLWKGPA
eukprot:scaffold154083_cov17-Tisochrysis_lutea.AAC.1